jgi:hypothetical protein
MHGPRGTALLIARVHLHEIPFQVEGWVEFNVPAVAVAKREGVTVAQKMQVGPCIPVGVQL